MCLCMIRNYGLILWQHTTTERMFVLTCFCCLWSSSADCPRKNICVCNIHTCIHTCIHPCPAFFFYILLLIFQICIKILHFCLWVLISHTPVFTLNTTDHNQPVPTAPGEPCLLFTGIAGGSTLPLLWHNSIQQIKRANLSWLQPTVVR